MNQNARAFVGGLLRGLIETVPIILVVVGVFAYYTWRTSQCDPLKCPSGESSVYIQGNCLCMRRAVP